MTAQDQIVVLTQSDQIRSTLQERRHPDCQIVISGIDQRPWPVRILGPDAKDGYFSGARSTRPAPTPSCWRAWPTRTNRRWPFTPRRPTGRASISAWTVRSRCALATAASPCFRCFPARCATLAPARPRRRPEAAPASHRHRGDFLVGGDQAVAHLHRGLEAQTGLCRSIITSLSEMPGAPSSNALAWSLAAFCACDTLRMERCSSAAKPDGPGASSASVAPPLCAARTTARICDSMLDAGQS